MLLIKLIICMNAESIVINSGALVFLGLLALHFMQVNY